MARTITITQAEGAPPSARIDGEWSAEALLFALEMVRDEIKMQAAMMAMQKQQAIVKATSSNLPPIIKRGA